MQSRSRTARNAKARRVAVRVDHGAPRARALHHLLTPRALARSSLRPGCVVWASIPFADDPMVSKTRPAVVVRVTGREVAVLPLTSSAREVVRLSNEYVLVEDWTAAGLTRPCRAWRRVATVDLMDVTLRVGELSPADRARVLDGFAPQTS
jgi:hypothetical protein